MRCPYIHTYIHTYMQVFFLNLYHLMILLARLILGGKYIDNQLPTQHTYPTYLPTCQPTHLKLRPWMVWNGAPSSTWPVARSVATSSRLLSLSTTSSGLGQLGLGGLSSASSCPLQSTAWPWRNPTIGSILPWTVEVFLCHRRSRSFSG